MVPTTMAPSLQDTARRPKPERYSVAKAVAKSAFAVGTPTPAPAAGTAVPKEPSPGSASSCVPPMSTVASKVLASHKIVPRFAERYSIGDELGSGGFGFVVSAIRHPENVEVAVKFICKDKVPMHAWVKDPALGLMPMEVYVLKNVDHPGIIRFIEYFEDHQYFYLVMELHGTPWDSKVALQQKISPSPKEGNAKQERPHDCPVTSTPTPRPAAGDNVVCGKEPRTTCAVPTAVGADKSKDWSATVSPSLPRKGMVRRRSCDLFECIEHHTRFPEEDARYIFMQLVDSVNYLKSAGICHRDLKDENIVVDTNLRVKLVDFGSAVVTTHKRVFHRFYGTINYASPEILRGEPYHADAAEVWSLGVLLYTLLYGEVPFSDPKQAIWGRYADPKIKVSISGVDLLDRMLEKDASKRPDIAEVRRHPWLASAARRHTAAVAVQRAPPITGDDADRDDDGLGTPPSG